MTRISSIILLAAAIATMSGCMAGDVSDSDAMGAEASGGNEGASQWLVANEEAAELGSTDTLQGCGDIYLHPCDGFCDNGLVVDDDGYCFLPSGTTTLVRDGEETFPRPVTSLSRRVYAEVLEQIAAEGEFKGSNRRVHLDLGGEGPHEFFGVYSGFEDAINLNAVSTWSPNNFFGNVPIANLVLVDFNERYPFAANTADMITVEGAPLTTHNAREIARIIKPGGMIWTTDNSNLSTLLEITEGRVLDAEETGDLFAHSRNDGEVENRTTGIFVQAGNCGGVDELACHVFDGYPAACFLCPWHVPAFRWDCGSGLVLDNDNICRLKDEEPSEGGGDDSDGGCQAGSSVPGRGTGLVLLGIGWMIWRRRNRPLAA